MSKRQQRQQPAELDPRELDRWIFSGTEYKVSSNVQNVYEKGSLKLKQ